MASKAVVAKKRLDAIRRLEAAMEVLGERFNVEAPDIPQRGRDPMLVQAKQLEALADWAEALDEATRSPEPTTDGSESEDAHNAGTKPRRKKKSEAEGPESGGVEE